VDEEDSQDSIRNFINNTKKLQKQGTGSKNLVASGKKETKNFMRMQSEYQDSRKNNIIILTKENHDKKNQILKTYTLENNDFKNNKNSNIIINKINNLDEIDDIEIKFKDGRIQRMKSNFGNSVNDYNTNNKESLIDIKFNTNLTRDNCIDPKFNTNPVINPNKKNMNSKLIKQSSNITSESKEILINPSINLTPKSDKIPISVANNSKNKETKKGINIRNNIVDIKENKLNNQNGKDLIGINQLNNDKITNSIDQGKLNKGNFENQILERINSTEMKERRKCKILELNNQQSNNNVQGANFRLSKDQMIKISNEPIQKYYYIISDLGHGSYGMVKKVKHKHIGEERAMKIVRKKLDSQNEIDILKKISHPNIISIYEIFEDSKNYYIMSELLEGGELFEEITRHGSFDEYEAANIMKQILNAVNYMHNKLIVHRDLKPENIMLISKANSKFEIKIIDFGTAKQFEKGSKLSKFIGTSYYIAPEVLSESYDEKCDVWSCGVILYILLSGYPPFNGASNLDIYHAIKYSPPNFSGDEWKEVSREAIDLIKIMLNKFPQKRFSAEQCMQHKWFSLLNKVEEGGLNKVASKPKFNQLKAINRMSNFVMENRLKQSVLQFISTQFNLKEEERSLRQLFQQFDTEKKGYITYASFYQVLSKYFGENEAKLISDKMFENLDLDGSGEISYNEFITAIIDNKSMVTNERLEKTFKMFDKVR